MRKIAPYFGSPVFIRSGKAYPTVHIDGYVPLDAMRQTGQVSEESEGQAGLSIYFLPGP